MSTLGEVVVPCGESGPWKIKERTVTKDEAEFDNLRALVHGSGWMAVRPGTYKVLSRNGTIVMSNTPMECRTNAEFVREATGRVLINGLGLGMVLTAVLKKPEVSFVRVVEISAELIAMVAPHFTDPRVEIVHANALEYRPAKGERFNAVWHDIWDSITEDNLPDMKLLHRRYGKLTDWQGSWARGWWR